MLHPEAKSTGHELREAPPAKQPNTLEVGLWVVAALIAIAGYFGIMLLSFSTAGCEEICHDDLIALAYNTYPWLLGISIAALFLVAVILGTLKRPTLWVAIVAVALTAIVTVGAVLVIETGLAPMRQRNAQIEAGTLPTPSPSERPDPTGRWTAADSLHPRPTLNLKADHNIEGFDGCNMFGGRWNSGVEGPIELSLKIEGTSTCNGTDTWLSRATSGVIQDGNLIVSNQSGTPIGALSPAP